MWLLGDKTHGSIILQSPLSSPLPDRGKESSVDRDAGILICCYSRTQASGFPHLPFLHQHPPPPPQANPILLFPGIQASGSQSLPLVLTARPPALGPSRLCPCTPYLSPQHCYWVSNSLSFHCQGPRHISGNLAPAVLYYFWLRALLLMYLYRPNSVLAWGT